MSAWCPWYARTGQYVRHKLSGRTGEIVWRHPNGRDVEVQMDGGTGDPLCWFGENIEPIAESARNRRRETW